MTDDVIRDTKETHVLKCPMTKQEIESEHVTLVDTLQRIDEVLLEEKTLKSQIKVKKDTLAQLIEDCRTHIRDKVIMRSIECNLSLNLSRLTATLTRLDTGEVVNERPLSNEEKRLVQQPSLFPDEPDVPDEAVQAVAESVLGVQDDGTIPADFEVRKHGDANPTIAPDAEMDHTSATAGVGIAGNANDEPEDPTTKPTAHPDELEEQIEAAEEGVTTQEDDDEFDFSFTD